MKDETRQWLEYAEDNLKSAEVLLDNGLLNPCLQNAQQAVEKMLKAALVESSVKPRKTHSISELVRLLAENDINVHLSEEESELLDSIYLPSKYPLGGVLPGFEPDHQTCKTCVAIAKRVKEYVLGILC